MISQLRPGALLAKLKGADLPFATPIAEAPTPQWVNRVYPPEPTLEMNLEQLTDLLRELGSATVAVDGRTIRVTVEPEPVAVLHLAEWRAQRRLMAELTD